MLSFCYGHICVCYLYEKTRECATWTENFFVYQLKKFNDAEMLQPQTYLQRLRANLNKKERIKCLGIEM